MVNTSSNTTIDVSSNLLQGTKFTMTLGRCPNFTFFLQESSIPGISIDEVVQTGPLAPVHRAGTKAYYDTLDVSVLVDENMQSWFEIHNWVRGLAPITGTTIPTTPPLFKTSRYSDITVTVLNNSNIPKTRFQYYSAYPVKFGKVMLDTRYTPDNILTFPVTFRYTYYDPIIVG